MSNSNSNPTSNSSSNSNANTNTQNSANNSSNVSRSWSPYGRAVIHQRNATDGQPQTQELVPDRRADQAVSHEWLSSRTHLEADTHQNSRPSTPSVVYLVTSHFIAQTTLDGVRLSESDIIGYQVLAVFAHIDDANSYAEHEYEEIDVGVRHRRGRRLQGGAVGGPNGEGVHVDVVVHPNGTTSWTIENVGLIEVTQWAVQ